MRATHTELSILSQREGRNRVASHGPLHYASGMTKTLLLLPILLLPGAASAVFCKSINSDGIVSYADVPAAECEQEVKMPDYSRYAPRTVTSSDRRSSAAPVQAGQTVGYKNMSITQPKPGGVARSSEGTVAVEIGLQPSLQQGHSVVLYLDGLPVPGSFDGTAIQLSNIERGTHTLRASVTDAAGRVLISSSSVPFTLRKPSLFDPARQTDEGENGDGEGNNGNGGGNGDDDPAPQPYDPGFQQQFTPGDAADYSPGGTGISSTPGQSNPAFSPNYSPN